MKTATPTLKAVPGKNGKPVIRGLPDWPFPDIDQRRFSKLAPSQQIEIQGSVRDRIEIFEAINEKKKTPVPYLRLVQAGKSVPFGPPSNSGSAV